MTLTREFKETVQARARSDKRFRAELLREAVELFLQNETETAKTILRDYVNATAGFDKVASATGLPVKSLMRMLSPQGNPQASNLFNILAYLQKVGKVTLQVKA